MCVLLPTIKLSVFAEACFSSLSDICECSGALQMAPPCLDKQLASRELPHGWPEILSMGLVIFTNYWIKYLNCGHFSQPSIEEQLYVFMNWNNSLSIYNCVDKMLCKSSHKLYGLFMLLCIDGFQNYHEFEFYSWNIAAASTSLHYWNQVKPFALITASILQSL